ncbi:LiaF domain-containing protein [Timonella sp. A28]|uniref:LiaF domain-containing protein n=1 Tax=Timonella sp. A28 TaxID=3442640 RepID=UPI003EBCF4CB
MIAGSIALPGIKIGEGNFSGISDAKYVPTSVETLTEGTSFGIGDITLDLTELDRAELRSYSSTPINIPLSGGIGELRIIVPADIPTTADTAVAVGSVSDTHGSQGGIGRSTITYENELVANGAEPILHLDLSVGVGEISIKEK